MLILYILRFTGKSRISSNPLPSTNVLFCNSATLSTFCLQWRLLLTKPSEKVQVSLIFIFPSMFYVSYVLRISICLREEIYTPSQTKKKKPEAFYSREERGTLKRREKSWTVRNITHQGAVGAINFPYNEELSRRPGLTSWWKPQDLWRGVLRKLFFLRFPGPRSEIDRGKSHAEIIIMTSFCGRGFEALSKPYGWRRCIVRSRDAWRG